MGSGITDQGWMAMAGAHIVSPSPSLMSIELCIRCDILRCILGSGGDRDTLHLHTLSAMTRTLSSPHVHLAHPSFYESRCPLPNFPPRLSPPPIQLIVDAS